MIRILTSALLVAFTLGACNPEGPTGPKSFSIFDVYGLWKVRMAGPGCGPAEVVNLDFGPLGLTATADSVRISGGWYLDEINPMSRDLRGFIYRASGLAYFALDNAETKIIEGVFVSNKDFAGAYRELEVCTVRLRGRFIE